MVQKIQNLTTEETDQQVEIEWSKVMATRNKLLEVSDWTQLPDVFLQIEAKKAWGQWRQKLRRVNRKTFGDIEQAKSVLDLLSRERPTSTSLSEKDFEDKFANTDTATDRIVTKTVIKEQPVILQENIKPEAFADLLKQALEKDSLGFKNYLLGFLQLTNTNIFTEEDPLETSKHKAKMYLAEQQTFSLDRKLKMLPDIRILTQRTEEALDYLTKNEPSLDNYPMLKLHSDSMSMTAHESAVNFLKQKKWYNQLLLESDMFLFYNTKSIEAATDVNELQGIIENIKNGY